MRTGMGAFGLWVAVVLAGNSAWSRPAYAEPLYAGMAKARAAIQHVIIIMQENRSFDHYFGTFPGADGIPMNADGVPTVCYPIVFGQPQCVLPFHDPHDINAGGPHSWQASVSSIHGGAMDGFVVTQKGILTNCGLDTPRRAPCPPQLLPGLARNDAASYHTAAEIPNYWAYASNFVLQDHFFEPAEDFSLTAHLYMVSAWSAKCTNLSDPLTCYSDIQLTSADARSHQFAWSSAADLLDAAGVTWKYYFNNGAQPDCPDGEFTCPPDEVSGDPGVSGIWNPVSGFTTIQAKVAQSPDYLKVHNPPLIQFYRDLSKGHLPAVSWIVPDNLTSEHPSNGVQEGMEYVTAMVNAVMQSQYWNNTTIFVSWDDWGGFLDHEPPPIADYVVVNGNKTIPLGYGIRVPGLIISPWVRPQIDHQVTSFDAYLKFIEDVFLGSARIGAPGTVRPDSRTTIRESLTQISTRSGGNEPVGDLMNDFDFDQTPLPPMVLSTLIPTNFVGSIDKTGIYHFPLTWDPVSTGPVLGYNVLRTTTSGSGYQPVPGCSTANGAYFTGNACTDSTAVKGTAYHYILVIAPDGTTSPNSGEMDITP